MKKGTLLALIPALALLVPACSKHLKPGESDYAHFGGTLTSVEPAVYEEVVKVTFKAMQGLALKPMEHDRDGFRTLIVGESEFGRVSQSHEVRVWITRLSEGGTEIKMRILGRRDQDRLQALLGEIRKQLPTAKAGPVEAGPAKTG